MHVWDYSLIRIGGQSINNLLSMKAKKAVNEINEAIKIEKEINLLSASISERMHPIIRIHGDDKDTLGPLINLRRDIFNKKGLKLAQFEKLHSKLPIDVSDDIKRFVEVQSQLTQKNAAFKQLFNEEFLHIKDSIKSAINNNKFKSGLLLGSISLYNQLDKYLAAPNDLQSAKWDGEDIGYMKYYSRMVAKTSPFSTFTNLSIGRFKKTAASISLQDVQCTNVTEYSSLIRLNNHILKMFLQLLFTYQPFRKHIYLRLNHTLHTSKGKFSYLINNNNSEAFQQMDKQPLLVYIIKFIFKRPRSFQQIVDEVAVVTESDEKSANNYVQKLLDLGILEYDLKISGADPDWLVTLINYLSKLLARDSDGGLESLLKELKEVEALCVSYETAGNQDRYQILTHLYKKIYGVYLNLHQQANLPAIEREMMQKFISGTLKADELNNYRKEFINTVDDTFQKFNETLLLIKQEAILLEDTKLKGDFYVNNDFKEDTIPFLNRLCNLVRFSHYSMEEIQTMTNFFLNQYGKDKQVPLLKCYRQYYEMIKDNNEMLDKNSETQIALEIEWGKTFGEKYKTLPKETEEINIKLQDIEHTNKKMQVAFKKKPIRSYGTFVQPCWDAETGAGRIMINTILQGNGKFMSRFLPLFDNSVLDYCQKTNIEAMGDKIFAEHNDSSFFNANIHPPLMPFEMITTGNNSYMAPSQQISVKEIAIKYNEVEERLQLVNVKTAKEVMVFDLSFQSMAGRSALFIFLSKFSNILIPHLGILTSSIINALDFSSVEEGEKGSTEIKYCPRIVVEDKIVLSRRKWLIPPKALPELSKQDSFAAKFKTIKSWQIDNKLPTECFIAVTLQNNGQSLGKKISRDNFKPQFMDFDNPLLVKLFLKYFQKDASIILEEMYPDKNALFTHQNSKYVLELLMQWNN